MPRKNAVPQKTIEEVIAAIRECAAELGRVPSIPELLVHKKLSIHILRKTFGTYTKAVSAAGLGQPRGIRIRMDELFDEWAALVRKRQKLPTKAEYNLASRHSTVPLMNRFGAWQGVPRGMLRYAEENNLHEQWQDVMEIIRRDSPEPAETSSMTTSTTPKKPEVMPDRRVYGDWLLTPEMAHAPTNEAGVMFLFGTVARRLGFVLLWFGTEFPDCEAMRETAPHRWQRVRIELEFQSRNFVTHRHDAKGCDLIVCWQHNWEEAPMEVIELRKALGDRRDRA